MSKPDILCIPIPSSSDPLLYRKKKRERREKEEREEGRRWEGGKEEG